MNETWTIRIEHFAHRHIKVEGCCDTLEPCIELGPKTITGVDEITTPCQYGQSYKAQLDGISVFIKEPPRVKEEKSEIAHYEKMKIRFEEEFGKFQTLALIKSRAESDSKELPYVSLAQPIALAFRDSVPLLLYEYVHHTEEYERLDEVLQKLKPTNGNVLGKCKADRLLAFGQALARILQRIHNNGIAHTFLVPRNIIVPRGLHEWLCDASVPNGKAPVPTKPLYVVGFGYSTFCDRERPQFQAENLDKIERAYLAPECGRSESLGMLWHPADIYSIGAIIYALATGEPPVEERKDVDSLKQDIYSSLNRKNSDLVDDNENILKLIDSCLRSDPEDRLSCIEEFIQAVKIAERCRKTSPDLKTQATLTSPPSIAAARSNMSVASHRASTIVPQIIADLMTHVNANPPPHLDLPQVFSEAILRCGASFCEDFDRMQRGHYEVYGSRDRIVTSLCGLLATAEQDSEYCTLTLTGYWTDDNLGMNGRFLTMCKHMARHHIQVRRLFLVHDTFHNLQECDQRILEHQYAAEMHVDSYLNTHNPLTGQKRGLKIKVDVVNSADDLFEFEKRGPLVGYLKPKENNPVVCLNFLSRGKIEWHGRNRLVKRKIGKVRFWTANDPHKSKFQADEAQFQSRWDNAKDLAVYMGRCTAESSKKQIKLPTLADLVGKPTG